MRKVITIVVAILLFLNIKITYGATPYEAYTVNANEEFARENYGDYSARILAKNRNTGVLKGKNLLILEVDGLVNDAKKYMPYLSKLEQGCFSFDGFYNASAKDNLEDSLIANIYSIYPSMKHEGAKIIDDRETKSIANIFSEEGKKTIYFNYGKTERDFKNTDYKKMGFAEVQILNEKKDSLAEKIGDFAKKNRSGFMIYATTNPKQNPLKKNLNKENIANEYRVLDDEIRDIMNALGDEVYGETGLVIVGKNTMDRQVKPIENMSFMSDNTLYTENMALIFSGLGKGKLKVNATNVDLGASLLNLYGYNEKAYAVFGKDLFDSSLMANNSASIGIGMGLRIAVYDNIGAKVFMGGNIKNVVAFDISTGKDLPEINPYVLIKKAFRDANLSYGMLKIDKLKEISLNSGRLKKADPNKVIAHAGGEILGQTYTNSIDAMDKAYKEGKRFFEIDFSETSDEENVALHSWEGFVEYFYNAPYEVGGKKRDYTKENFMNFSEVHGFSQMSIKDVIAWMREHRDARLITDAKSSNIETLKKIAEQGADIANRILPQIYQFNEYDLVRGLGYKNIILTLYLNNGYPIELYSFVKEHELYAITLSYEKFMADEGKAVQLTGKPIFVHTINKYEDYEKLLGMGVEMVYSDSL